MSLYERYILPPLLHWACGHPSFAELRAKWIPHAAGTVLEIGVGSGRNLPYFVPEKMTEYIGMDPFLDPGKLERFELPFPCQFERESGEKIPLPDDSVDTVVCTFTLCSVRNPEQVRNEIERVLKPSGQWILVEHGRAPDPGIARWQDLLNPLWRPLAGNCHLNRCVEASVVGSSRWKWTSKESTYLRGLARVAGFVTSGIAVPSSPGACKT